MKGKLARTAAIQPMAYIRLYDANPMAETIIWKRIKELTTDSRKSLSAHNNAGEWASMRGGPLLLTKRNLYRIYYPADTLSIIHYLLLLHRSVSHFQSNHRGNLILDACCSCHWRTLISLYSETVAWDELGKQLIKYFVRSIFPEDWRNDGDILAMDSAARWASSVGSTQPNWLCHSVLNSGKNSIKSIDHRINILSAWWKRIIQTNQSTHIDIFLCFISVKLQSIWWSFRKIDTGQLMLSDSNWKCEKLPKFLA